MAANITGISDITKAFAILGSDVQQKVGRRMVASAAGIIKKQAKANVQSKGLIKTRALINNIVVKRDTKAPSGSIQYNVGVRHGRSLTKKQKSNSKLVIKRPRGRVTVKYLNDPFYWRFLEFGRKIVPRQSGDGESVFGSHMHRLRNGIYKKRFTTSNSQSLRNRRKSATRKVQPTPFLAPALEQKQSEALDQMRKVLNRELSKARV